MNNTCEKLLLSSLTDFYSNNTKYNKILKDIIYGKHKLSLRLIDWLVTHYSKNNNIFYWINKKTNKLYEYYPDNIDNDTDFKNIKKVNLYLDYRAQLKSYAKLNFDSFRRHNRITFFFNIQVNDYIETTIGQLNFFRWAFDNNIIEYALNNYDKIYEDMIKNTYKNKYHKNKINNIQEITKSRCILRFD